MRFKAKGMLTDLAKEWMDMLRRHCRRIEWVLVKRLRKEVTLHTYQGILTFKTNDSVIAPHFWLNRECEYSSSVKCIQFLRANGFIADGHDITLYDIGANNGFISIGLMLAGQVDRVVAFEPHPDNFSLLERNIKQNGLESKIKAFNVALSSEVGELNLEVSRSNTGDHRIKSDVSLVMGIEGEDSRKIVRVQALTLDSFIGENTDPSMKPSIIWMDVQGHDGLVLAGAQKPWLRAMPAVVEICPYMVLRAGMTLGHYSSLYQGIWDYFWVERRGRYIRYPLSMFNLYLDELGTSGDFCNVIFTASSSS